MTYEEHEKYRNKLIGILKKNPNCTWAKNELKYLDLQPMSMGSVVVSGGAYKADSEYHGGYME